MSQERLTKLECTECHVVHYHVQKNKKKLHQAGKLELSKYCPVKHKHVLQRETK